MNNVELWENGELGRCIDHAAVAQGSKQEVDEALGDASAELRAILAAAPQPPVQDSCVRCGKETVCGKTHCEACCYEPISAPQPSDDVAKDAARYRFVRKLENDCWMLNTLKSVSEAELDAAIDAAMAGGE